MACSSSEYSSYAEGVPSTRRRTAAARGERFFPAYLNPKSMKAGMNLAIVLIREAGGVVPKMPDAGPDSCLGPQVLTLENKNAQK